MGKYKKMSGACIVVVALLLGGCGKEPIVDYTVNGETESSVKEEGVEQFLNAAHWEENWATENQKGDSIAITVDADVLIPQAAQMHVVSVSEPEMGEGYRENIANRCFTEGSIYYMDEAHRPKGWWKEEQGRLEQLQRQLDDKDDSMYEAYQEEILNCQEKWEQAPDSYQPAEKFDVDEYMGYRDGISYELSVRTQEENEIGEKSGHIKFAAEDISVVCPGQMKEVEDLIHCRGDKELFEKENECGFTVDEARQKVQAFLEELGLSYSAYVYSCPLVWGNSAKIEGKDSRQLEDGDYCIDGYEIQFALGVDDVPFSERGVNVLLSGMAGSEIEGLDTLVYSADAYVIVDISKKGIVAMEAWNPVTVDNISNPVRLLPLQTIQDIMQTQVEQNFDSLDFDETDRFAMTPYNAMELVYFRVTDKENTGHYSYIPVWRLAFTMDVITPGLDRDRCMVTFELNELMINAMDGSVVKFTEDYFGV